MVVAFIIWIVLSLVVANAGSRRNIGFGWSLFWCLILSPIIGALIVLLSDRKSDKVTINTQTTISKYKDVVEQAKMLEFKGQKDAALDKYMDGYYLFQQGVKKKTIYPTLQSAETDTFFRAKISELGGIVPDGVINVEKVYKETAQLQKEKAKVGNRNLIIALIVVAAIYIAIMLVVKQPS